MTIAMMSNRVGGTWMLEFEYSNPNSEPVCYCVGFTGMTPNPMEAYLLAALDEVNQTLDVTLWTNQHGCENPASGELRISRGDTDPDWWVESFFDVFYEPWHTEVPVGPGEFLPGENFQFEIAADFFGPGSDPFDGVVYDECVIVTPMGTLEPWYPSSPCMDNVPPSMNAGESVCFEVCHKVYDVILGPGTEDAVPIINVMPGCDLPCSNPGCTPGGVFDYCYNTWFDGIQWHLEFEYSNPMIEPVCYCVTYEGNRPECQPHELAALDELEQMFQVTLWVTGEEMPPCVTSGSVEVCRSDQPGMTYNPFPGGFAAYDDYLTGEVPADNDSALPPGTQVTFTAHIDYDEPYDDVWLTEEVIVGPTGLFEIDDTGGECFGDNVPPSMEPNTPYCFEVCHQVYHIDLGIYSQEPVPTVNVIPGCSEPCIDPGCVPGGEYDYCYNLVWMGDHYELEFEYSNEMIEPVCYCVTVETTEAPCETHVLVALDEINQLVKVSLLSFDPGGIEPCEVSGTVTLSSNPPELYFEETTWTFSGVGDTWVTYGKPSAPEPYNPGHAPAIVVEIDYDDPSIPDVIETEMVEMDLTGGLKINDVGGECAAGGGSHVPPELFLGQPECFIVCHDIYYIPLNVGYGIPQVSVTPGCATPCVDPGCVPGGPFDYRYDVFRVGGTWFLEFEYSNENIEPVCYCVEVTGLTPIESEAYVLTSLDEANQTLDITLWTGETSCDWPAQGVVRVARGLNDPDFRG